MNKQLVKTTNRQAKQKAKNQPAAKVTGIPASVATAIKRTNPKVSTTKDGSCNVEHFEYIADVFSSPTNRVYSYPINPQNPGTFSWAFALATRYEMYKFSNLSFHYRPSIATSTNGFVVMGFDYDAYDPSPSKSSILNWKFSSKCAVWEAADLSVTSGLGNVPAKYCNATSPAGSDKRIDNLGNLFLMTQSVGLATDTVIGELFVSYSVKLIIPSLIIPNALYWKSFNPSATSTSDYLGSASFFPGTVSTASNLNVERVSGNVFRINTPGKYIIDSQIGGVSSTAPVPVFSATASYPGTNFISSILAATTNNTDAATVSNALNLINGSVEVTIPAMLSSLASYALRISTNGVGN